MAAPPISIPDRHHTVGSISYRMGTLTFCIALVIAVAVTLIVSCAIVALKTHTLFLTKERVKIILGAVGAIICTIPFFFKVISLQKKITTERSLLLDAMKAEVTPLEVMPIPMSTMVIENKLLKDQNGCRWHHTYQSAIIKEITESFPKDQFPNIHKALEAVQKNISKALEEGGDDED